MDRLFEEIEWFGDNKIPYVDVCDANFGIFVDRDMELAKKLKSEKEEKGYLGRIRQTFGLRFLLIKLYLLLKSY